MCTGHISAPIPFRVGQLNYPHHTLTSWYVTIILFWITLWTKPFKCEYIVAWLWIDLLNTYTVVDTSKSLLVAALTRNPSCKHKQFPTKWLSKPQLMCRVWFRMAKKAADLSLYYHNACLCFYNVGPQLWSRTLHTHNKNHTVTNGYQAHLFIVIHLAMHSSSLYAGIIIDKLIF